MMARAGLGKASLVEAYARAAGSMLSTTTRTCGRPGVLYEDRGVIVLNKPPGLVSQGTSSTAADAKSDCPETTPPRAAFDDVLDGTVQLLSFVVGRNLSATRLTHLSTFRPQTGVRPQYKSVSGPSARQGTTELEEPKAHFLRRS
jgi:hypothetical protein